MDFWHLTYIISAFLHLTRMNHPEPPVVQEGGALKLVSDPDQTLQDAGCITAG